MAIDRNALEMNHIGQLEIGPVEKVLMACGLWAADRPIPAGLQVSESELTAPGFEEQIFIRSLEDKLVPMLVGYAQSRGWQLSNEARAISEIYNAKMEALFQDLGPILEALTAEGVTPMLIKGGDLALTAYRDGLARMMADLDILVKPSDLPTVVDVFSNAGLVQARVNMATMQLMPLSDDEARAVAENHYELAPFVGFRKLEGLSHHRQVIEQYLKERFFTVVGDEVFFGEGYDVHFNVSDSIEIADLWRSPRQLIMPTGQPVLAPSATEVVWFLAARGYHEAMFDDTPSLRPFFDLAAALAAHAEAVDWDRVVAMANKYSFHPSLFYLFWHVNELFGDLVPNEVMTACNPARREVSRAHDWGDPLPKMLRTTLIGAVLEKS